MQLQVERTLERLDTPQNRLILTAVALVSVAALGFYVARALRRRAAYKRLHLGIVSTGTEFLHNVLVPDGMGASMHVDYLLLTSRGVVVIDLRDVRGNIFGGDQMTEWTVMSGATRATFQNPQHALYDRVAAVRALAGELPVEGRVLFTRRGKFPKGLPRWTLMVDSLRAEFPPVDSEASQSWIARYSKDWQAIAAAVTPSTLRLRRGFLADVFYEKF
ncbi:MAG: nuclease-related domain-containing protein [Steroidobacteraceae bacterium]